MEEIQHEVANEPETPKKIPKALSKPRMTLRNPAVLLQLSIETLKQVGTGGLSNWALVGPDVDKLPMLGGGQGGVDEMRAAAMENQDLVMYGLLRLQFSAPGFSQTRVAMLHIIGESVPTVKKGRLNALRPRMEKRFRDFANLACVIPDVAPQDVTLETIMDKMGFAADYTFEGGGAKESKVSALKAYQESLIKEQTMAAVAKKAKPAAALAHKVVEEPEAPEVEKLGQTMISLTAPDAASQVTEEPEEEEEEESESEDEEKEELAPHSDLQIEEVNDLVRLKRECNWALIRPRPKGAAGSKLA